MRGLRSSGGASAGHPRDLSPGSTVGAYLLERLIAAGAASEVWLATHSGHAHQRVALKVATGGPSAEARLRREAETLESLAHPSIIRVLDVVVQPDCVALALPYLAGGPLSRIIAAGPTSHGVVSKVATTIAAALEAAHCRGVIHGDVSPSNILLSDDHTQVVLADFDSARAERLDPVALAGGLSRGTADYLDPAVADGARPDVSSDIYSLGVVCYELLTGTPPFDGPTVASILRAADRGGYTPLTSAVAELPSTLVDAVEMAMARHPGDRHDSAAAFHAALLGVDTCACERRVTTEFGPRPPQPPGPRLPQPSPVVDARGRRPVSPKGRLVSASVAAAVTGVLGLTAIQIAHPGRHHQHRPAPHQALTGALASAGIPIATPTRPDPAPERPGGDPAVEMAIGCPLTKVANTDGAPVAARSPTPTITATTPSRRLAGAGCPAQAVWSGGILDVSWSAGVAPVQYALGDVGDQVVLGHFSTNGEVTPALYRPATGEVWTWSSWPATADSEVTGVRRDGLGALGGTLVVGVNALGQEQPEVR